ncbi:hypothetical protein FIBSPDRAFT_692145, partial [Athelia psychrophila]
PPRLPPDSLYAGCYCEENIYLLARQFALDPALARAWDVFAVFISNGSKTVALWNQRLAATPGEVVVWDYHVVLLLRVKAKHLDANQRGQIEWPSAAWIYDFDSVLNGASMGDPISWQSASAMTYATPIPQVTSAPGWTLVLLDADSEEFYRSVFRVVPADTLFAQFASDRSHMLVPVDSPRYRPASPHAYTAPLPAWPAIRGAGVGAEVATNLMAAFVGM